MRHSYPDSALSGSTRGFRARRSINDGAALLVRQQLRRRTRADHRQAGSLFACCSPSSSAGMRLGSERVVGSWNAGSWSQRHRVCHSEPEAMVCLAYQAHMVASELGIRSSLVDSLHADRDLVRTYPGCVSWKRTACPACLFGAGGLEPGMGPSFLRRAPHPRGLLLVGMPHPPSPHGAPLPTFARSPAVCPAGCSRRLRCSPRQPQWRANFTLRREQRLRVSWCRTSPGYRSRPCSMCGSGS